MLFSKRHKSANAKWKLIGLGGKIVIDILFAGSRIQVENRRPIEPILASRHYIFAFWHSRILLISYMHKGWNAAIMVSDSADGEIIARILQRQGHTTIRGSTRKGGLRALVRMSKDIVARQRPAGVVPDGPRGPRHQVHPGIIILAKKTGYPIIPVTYSAEKRWVFNSWDRFILPYPWSPCRLIYGNPLFVPPQADTHAIQVYQTALENELNRITNEADACFNHRFAP